MLRFRYNLGSWDLLGISLQLEQWAAAFAAHVAVWGDHCTLLRIQQVA